MPGLPQLVNHLRKPRPASIDDHRRSTVLAKLARLYSLGLLTEEELGAFSEETRETALLLASHGRP
jgi:hypothetical protein